MKRKIGIGKGPEERVHRKYRFYSYIKKIFRAVKRSQSWKEQRSWCSASRVTRRRGESDLRPCVSETEALGWTGSL